jgi:hypothetical protein
VIFTGQDVVRHIRQPETLRTLQLRHWDVLLRVCRRANLLGRLAEALNAEGIDSELPHQVQVHLLSARVLTGHQRDAIAWELQHIGKALTELQVPVVVLKGAAYAIRGLNAARGRLFGDVDVLVPRAKLNDTEAALMLQGWASGQHDAYDERYYREWMHEIPPMTHRARGTVIDVHHNILPSTARHCPDAGILVAASESVGGTIFRTLCPADMVIHSATHLFHESELQNGLRDLFDLDSLLVEFSGRLSGFWVDLASRATLLGLTLPLLLALRNSRAILGTNVPLDLIPQLQSTANVSSLTMQTLDTLYLRALMPDHPASRCWQESLARALIYLRGHALRMPPRMLALHLGRKSILRLVRNTSRSM